MKKVNEVLAFIPARGGSKRLPKKNILKLGDKPLVAYSIEAAYKSSRITRVFVSTDDPEIAEISRDFGAEVPFLRPKYLSGDNANMKDAINHTLNVLYEKESYEPDAIMYVFPNYPFKTFSDLDYYVEKLNQGISSVLSARSIGYRPYAYMTLEKDRLNLLEVSLPGIKRLSKEMHQFCANFNIARVEPWGKLYHLTSNPEDLLKRLKELQFESEKRGDYKHMYAINPVDSIRSIDIDTLEDFKKAERVVQMGLFNFESKEPFSSINIMPESLTK